MKKFIVTIILFFAVLFVLKSFSGSTITSAEVTNPVVTPVINYVGTEHSPLVEGDTQTLTVTSAKYTGKVQYSEYLLDGSKWIKLQGYSVAVDSTTPYVLKTTPALKLGKYKVLIYVKKAGVEGMQESANGNFDSYYTVELNCVSRDDSKRVYTDGAVHFTTIGMAVRFIGIDNIGGMEGPYYTKLFVMNTATGVWAGGFNTYVPCPEYTFETAGTYMVVAHITTPESRTWEKKGYEGLKTFIVIVKDDGSNVFNTTAKLESFGTLANVTLTAEGVKNFPTATQYKIVEGSSVNTAITNLGTPTTFPVNRVQDNVMVQLLDANNKVLKTFYVVLGQPGTLNHTVT